MVSQDVKRRAIVVLLSCIFTACATSEQVEESSVVPMSEFSLEELLRPESGPIGCRKMLDSYCSALHSPLTQGNLWVGRGPGAVPVLQGRTKNDFSNVYYFYALAKLKAKPDLPDDFRAALDNQEYFQKLTRVLNRANRSSMTLDSRIRSNRREQDVDRIWNSALAETVLRRLSKKFSGFHRLPEELIPIEQSVERFRTRNVLNSEVSRAIWKHDRNWSNVEAGFEKLRRHFVSVIQRLEISEDIRKDWIKRILSVKLVIPGAVPAIADSECSTTQVNAFYYSHLNLITVCAGDFNSENILQTLAHELAHSLDMDRSRYLFQSGSTFGKGLSALRENVCHPNTFTCEGWDRFKTDMTKNLDALSVFQPDLPEFQRCLKRRVTKKSLSPQDIERLAAESINDQLSTLASSGVFLRITKEQIPLPDGKITSNPNYMNPCSYRLWSQGEEPIDDDLTELLFFTAEYRCSQREPSDRLRNAIAVSKQMATQIASATIRMEGEFSPRSELALEGFSSSPVERFADVLGSYAFASYLSEIPDVMSRRYVFLASNSWQCDQPSLDTLYPEESRVQEAFVFDPHAETDERKKEEFSTPIQKAVGCVPDFKFSACELKMKQGG